MGLLAIQHLLWVIHPCWPVFLVLAAVTFAAGIGGLLRGLVRLLRGPRRLRAVGWTLAAVAPAACWVFLGCITLQRWQARQIRRDWPLMLTVRAAQCLMEAQAVCLYPRRLESERLVMFFDDHVADPEGDLRAMDRHIARMEALLDRPLRARIYWARGSLLGQRNLCCLGVSLGSDRSPAGVLDRHELAHAVLGQQENAALDPPTLLEEGWAESQAWDRTQLAERALSLRQLVRQGAALPAGDRAQFLKTLVDPEGFGLLFRQADAGREVLYLEELTDGYWYYRDKGPVYGLGGAFVNFVLRRKGARAFLEFHAACRPGNWDEQCRRVFGVGARELEREFWEDVERTAPPPAKRERPAAARK
jgi:hypothetical protein